MGTWVRAQVRLWSRGPGAWSEAPALSWGPDGGLRAQVGWVCPGSDTHGSGLGVGAGFLRSSGRQVALDLSRAFGVDRGPTVYGEFSARMESGSERGSESGLRFGR